MKRVPTKGSSTEEQFIHSQRIDLPWSMANDRVIKSFNLRLSESLHMKLKFISENRPYSIHNFIMMAVEEAVEKEIRELIA